jgi:cytoskeletal protein CcmA (bactofilin family)
MFNAQNEKGGLKEVETIIGPSVKVKGNFHGQGNIVVDGILDGSLKTQGNLFVGDKAKVTASVEAKEATINGEVIGNIKIKGFLEIGGTARITGDIDTASLSIARGAVLNGKCTMNVKETTLKETKG